MIAQSKLTRFNNHVLVKYQIYNSIFTTLPFDDIKHTGGLLPLFEDICRQGFADGKNPTEIVHQFYQKYISVGSEKEQLSLLFKFIQYIERQVVLFDAIEEAAFPIINNLDGIGTMRNSKEKALSEGKIDDLKKHLQKSKVRIVLTAHPTQFYTGEVLGIITDLGKSIENDDYVLTKKLLAQLGKTPFLKRKKPTPYQEAIRLIWYLENVFYKAVAQIHNYVSDTIFKGESFSNPFIEIGFWPGGDRDGNPFVTTETTLNVAQRLRESLIKNYHNDIRKLKRRLTFREVAVSIETMEDSLYQSMINPSLKPDFTAQSLYDDLFEVRSIIVAKHQSLFVDEIDDLLHKIQIFGLHFASLDIRQDSRVHEAVFSALLNTFPNLLPNGFDNLPETTQLKQLSEVDYAVDISKCKDDYLIRTLESMRAIKTIQTNNGEKGANRYIISNTQSAVHIMQVLAMLKVSTFPVRMPVDITPLFETVTDLENAAVVMEKLYNNEVYRAHLKFRENKQPIMLGFSDGTKDGGYLMANWGIYQAKENLTAISRKYNVDVIFFDGRGGPPARGGGKTHQFYASLGNKIENNEIQMTVQGQTISSHYGSLPAAQFNLEQLLSAGIENAVFYDDSNELSDINRQVLNDLAQHSYDAYVAFKKHPKFLSYLEKMSTLKYYGQTNIGSRPSKRGKSDALVFSDLRAIPFVGSWSQLKQNVPGFYGVGTALKEYEKSGTFEKVVQLYQDSDFFKTLIENSMMSLTKSFFELTAYMKNDAEFGAFWQLIYQEYETTKRLLLKLSGQQELMESYPVGKASIATREGIVLPLLTIQQFALQKIQYLKQESNPDTDLIEIYEKLVMRSLYGNVNASRNSA